MIIVHVWLLDKKLQDFNNYIGEDGSSEPRIKGLKEEVVAFAKKFPTVGFNEDEMKYVWWSLHLASQLFWRSIYVRAWYFSRSDRNISITTKDNRCRKLDNIRTDYITLLSANT